MILSMTGYGKSVAEYEGKKIHVEVKSLNSKALDLSTRIAPLYREKEMEIRQKIQQALIRGKVDFCIWIEKEAGLEDSASINQALVANYYKQLQETVKNIGLSTDSSYGSNSATDILQIVMRMPDVMTRAEVEQLTDEEWKVASAAIDEALKEITEYRRKEGAALEVKFNEKVDNIEALMNSIEPYETSRVEKIRARIVEGLKAIPEIEYDKNRLEQELIYYIEKLDISEEKQRLTQHLKYFRETMAEMDGGQGKKLGFIAQEMGREINTTGSKSNQAEMQNIVVQMKDELEQIKEQVLNAL
ncbi:MAG: YicC family protein [Prevotella sp.]|nr:YicC family protein [Prevotella sp.]